MGLFSTSGRVKALSSRSVRIAGSAFEAEGEAWRMVAQHSRRRNVPEEQLRQQPLRGRATARPLGLRTSRPAPWPVEVRVEAREHLRGEVQQGALAAPPARRRVGQVGRVGRVDRVGQAGRCRQCAAVRFGSRRSCSG